MSIVSSVYYTVNTQGQHYCILCILIKSEVARAMNGLMEEDHEYGGFRITMTRLKELSDRGREFFLSDSPTGSHLPSRMNVERQLPFMFCSVKG